MKDEVVVVKEKKCSLIGSLFRLATFAVAVYGAVMAAKKVLTRLATRLEEDNEGNESKRFLSCLGLREICLEGEEVSGVEVITAASSTELDLSEAILSDETFVKVRALGGKIVIKVPPMVRVKLEGKGVLCGFFDMVPSYEDESFPVVFVDAESIGACVKIKIGER